MTDDGFRIEDEISHEELKTLFRQNTNELLAIKKALRDLPEWPEGWVLAGLGMCSGASSGSDGAIARHFQVNERQPIPYKAECEWGAGFWWRLRKGLLENPPGTHPPAHRA